MTQEEALNELKNEIVESTLASRKNFVALKSREAVWEFRTAIEIKLPQVYLLIKDTTKIPKSLLEKIQKIFTDLIQFGIFPENDDDFELGDPEMENFIRDIISELSELRP